AIMIALFSFSLGVERGKSLAAQTLDERVAAAWNVNPRPVAAAPVPAVPAPVKVMPRPAADRGFIVGTGLRYTLQAATYANEQYAQGDALVLKGKGFPTFLIKSGKYWLLCIGNFSTKEAASGYSRKLPAVYRSSQVRRF
ncbi:MAG: SPOR domain-containing protein, partial [Candidatus Omnitrophica bacterium]|nr:SPOR domain-containing protein [Candidatus Omnitrophota bacterium]